MVSKLHDHFWFVRIPIIRARDNIFVSQDRDNLEDLDPSTNLRQWIQQQIVIKVPMSGEKNRTKVLTIVAKTHGVTSVAIKGLDRDRVVVTRSGVDSAELTRSLRKKIGDASIVCVQSLNERVREEEDRCCYATSNNCDQ
ncbi:hypothetical protein Dsin_023582 [Dipteronia sinensis]|uniref:HMA domain-containing protein n=1 Tax=Dipteronia sinensis TaxID=43782 RepID=A0AAE0A4K0_9ROSI|nr:hypothetical protein Dsin_023582 [Dipteronia sinensis]